MLIASRTIGVLALVWTMQTSGAEPLNPYEEPGAPPSTGKIDALVTAQLKREGIRPARLCSDGVFVRRAYLDVIGTLPTADEVKEFLADHNPGKRSVLIDRLLQRPEFADYWSLKWCDLLRVKSEFPINLWPNAVQAYYRWVHACIKSDVPYDRFVRELLTASGSNFRDPPVNFYRAMRDRDPMTIATTVALTVMAARAERWPQDRLRGMAVFFQDIEYRSTGEWKEEIVGVDLLGGTTREAVLPDGTRIVLKPGTDARVVFADWLIEPKNPWFARAIVNRIWYWLIGVGIVHEPDDIRADNLPINPELLALLERELIASRYDLKHIYRLILNSTTYQRSCIPTTVQPEAERLFAHYPMRRLDAEVLIDAINQVTGTTESYMSLIPEPWTYIPRDTRSIALADASITSPFLELFGRPARESGLESERTNAPTGSQRLHLLNSSHIQRKLSDSTKLRAMAQSKNAVDQLYLSILSRYPTDEERKIVASYKPGNRSLAVELAWALMNTAEFQHRH